LFGDFRHHKSGGITGMKFQIWCQCDSVPCAQKLEWRHVLRHVR